VPIRNGSRVPSRAQCGCGSRACRRRARGASSPFGAAPGTFCVRDDTFFVEAATIHRGCADATAWRLLAYAGCRRGEALAFRWRDPDVAKARLSVRRSVGLVRTRGQGAELVEGATKAAVSESSSTSGNRRAARMADGSGGS
jgi:integrase